MPVLGTVTLDVESYIIVIHVDSLDAWEHRTAAIRMSYREPIAWFQSAGRTGLIVGSD